MNIKPNQSDRATAPPSPTFIPAGRMGYQPGSERAVAPNRKSRVRADDVELIPEPAPTSARAPSRMTSLWILALLVSMGLAGAAVVLAVGLSLWMNG